MTDLSRRRDGAILDLLISDPAFDPIWKNIAKWQDRDDWRERMAYLRSNYDPEKVQPIYYCLAHGRFEDGAHRLALAKERGEALFSVQVHARCHHFRPTIFEVLSGMIAERISDPKQKDVRWLSACRDKKWIHLDREIDYRGASVLDVGSHCGYTCFRSVFAGAGHATGIEIRPELVSIATDAAPQLKVESRVNFTVGDWLEGSKRPGRFDIVHCMGLLHYFPAAVYPDALARLAASSTRTLVLELRLSQGPGVRLAASGIQTLPSAAWLEGRLAGHGFTVKGRFPVDEGKRGLWIAARR